MEIRGDEIRGDGIRGDEIRGKPVGPGTGPDPCPGHLPLAPCSHSARGGDWEGPHLPLLHAHWGASGTNLDCNSGTLFVVAWVPRVAIAKTKQTNS